MKSYEVVCAIIKNKDGKFFCCRRGPGRALNGFWEFPGGKVEKSETFEETIVREIKEELNSEVKPIKYLTTTKYVYPDYGGFPGFGIKLHAILCELVSGSLELSEHTESKWVTKEEMKEMNFAEADVPIIDYL